MPDAAGEPISDAARRRAALRCFRRALVLGAAARHAQRDSGAFVAADHRSPSRPTRRPAAAPGQPSAPPVRDSLRGGNASLLSENTITHIRPAETDGLLTRAFAVSYRGFYLQAISYQRCENTVVPDQVQSSYHHHGRATLTDQIPQLWRPTILPGG